MYPPNNPPEPSRPKACLGLVMIMMMTKRMVMMTKKMMMMVMMTKRMKMMRRTKRMMMTKRMVMMTKRMMMMMMMTKRMMRMRTMPAYLIDPIFLHLCVVCQPPKPDWTKYDFSNIFNIFGQNMISQTISIFLLHITQKPFVLIDL